MKKLAILELLKESAKAKVIAGVVAGTVVVGGTTTAVVINNRNKAVEANKPEVTENKDRVATVENNTSNDTKTEENKAEDKKVEEKNAEDKKAEDKKAEDKKTEDKKSQVVLASTASTSSNSTNSTSGSTTKSVNVPVAASKSVSSGSSTTNKATTSKPAAATSSKPAATSSKPAVTTSKPASNTSKPSSNTSSKPSRPSGYDESKTLEINSYAKNNTYVPRYGQEKYNQLVQAAMTVANGGSAKGMKVGDDTVCGETCKTVFFGNEPGAYYGVADTPYRVHGYMTYFVCYWNSAKNGYDEKAIAIGY